MNEPKMCLKQDSCPLLLGAIHAKVSAESNMRLAKATSMELRDNMRLREAEFAGKRQLMNELYAAAKKCRAAQRKYFSYKTQPTLVAARVAEEALDRVLALCSRSRTPQAPELPGLDGGREFHHD